MNENNDGFFTVVRISRDDFEMQGFDASKLSDNEMKRIASKIGDNLVENGGYWESVDHFAEVHNLPNKNEYKII